MNKRIRIKFFSVFIFISSLNIVQASPWTPVGDISLRNDVEILSTHGLISGPVNTWPMSWKQITRNFHKADSMEFPSFVRHALMRVREKTPNEFNIGLRAHITNNPTVVRGFESRARNNFDTSASIEYNGDSGTTIHIEGGYRSGNGEKYSHLDGSYISQDIGNWAAYAGTFDRWWGPGRESTLILSNNARPMPSIGFRRIEAKPFESKWLKWMGPWQWDMFLAKMEMDRHIPNSLLVGMRLNFNPINNFDVGLSRSMQLCGEGRPCGFNSWTKAMVSFGDLDNSGPSSSEPGNQLASIDLSYIHKLGERNNVKIYAEGTAEDQNVIMPFQFARLIGVSFYGPYGSGGDKWILSGEFSDTVSTHYWFGGRRKPHVIYNHHLYKTGYRYKGKSIGHSLDSSSQLLSFSAEYVSQYNWDFKIKYHNAIVNSSSANINTISSVREKINIVEFLVGFETPLGRLNGTLRMYDDSPNTIHEKKNGIDAELSWSIY
ncbi:MAG: capsule assembly Wzi family protein, partial [Emcibacteraceae bacterium]|nr:capsule assembly Wzi family protein [Emcibacteraceae bacterium]